MEAALDCMEAVLLPEDNKFLLDQWKDYAFHLDRTCLETGACGVCMDTLGLGCDMRKEITNVTDAINGFGLTPDQTSTFILHLTNQANHLKLDWPGIREDHESGWLGDDEYEHAMAVVPRLESLLGKAKSILEANLKPDPDDDKIKHAQIFSRSKPDFEAEDFEPETAKNTVETVTLAGHDVPKDYLDRYVESIEVLQRVSKISKTRPNPDMLFKALHNRTELHKAIFGICGLDHDSAAEAETAMRTAIDKYAEKDLAGKPGWEDFDLMTRH